MQEYTNTYRVSALYYYPIKSCRGLRVDRVEILDRGILNDRAFMIVDRSGSFVTQRELPQLTQIEPHIMGDVLTLSAPNVQPIQIRRQETGKVMPVTIWRDSCAAIDQGDDVATWLSTVTKTPCRLVHMERSFVRPVTHEYAPVETAQVGFADGFPFLLVSEASHDDLNSRMDEPLGIERFRPNIVVQGTSAFEEDSWREIRIGDVNFAVVKPCARCAITTTDQQTGQRGKEPLQTLATYRSVKGKGVMFGQNVVHLHNGAIKVGDAVEVLSST